MSRSGNEPLQIGRYQILSELGRGSMGIVRLAHDPTLDRNVALKYLRPDLRLSDEDREALMNRMRHEARAMARVSHPGIVSLFDMGEEEGVGVFLVFELADGSTLEETLRRGKLTTDGAARLAVDLGEALTAAHQASILHRDIKPANIMLTEFGARIADFGVARLPESTLTRAGAKVGTPAYSAPESIRHGAHSPASDQFSLAATLYEAISGRRAFPGEDAVAVARKIESEPPLTIAQGLGLSPSVDQVLRRGMAHTPSDRYPSCIAFGDALSRALVADRAPLPTMPDHRRLPEPTTKPTTFWSGLLVLALLVGALSGGLIMKLMNVEEETSPPADKPTRRAFLTPTPEPKK